MTRRSFIVIALLSIPLTYIADIIDAIINGTLLGGASGFPFKDNHTTLFGGGTIDSFKFFLNGDHFGILGTVLKKIALAIHVDKLFST